MKSLGFKELVEWLVIICVWQVLLLAHRFEWAGPAALTWAMVIIAGLKFCYFLAENGMHIVTATKSDVPYHYFLMFMAYNIGQMSVSFALDFHVIYTLDRASMNGIPEATAGAELLFEFFFYSVLNFSFFGFGEVTPTTVPMKIITLMEVVMALLTVIFILGDFISIRESVKSEDKK